MDVFAIIFILIVCIAMPVLAIRTARQIERHNLRPSLRDLFASTLITHAVLVALALLAAHRNNLALFPRPSLQWQVALAGAAFLLTALAVMLVRSRRQSAAESTRMSWMRPQRRSDLWLWLGISLIAGIAEEIVYRGALLGLLAPRVGGEWPAIALCVIAFGLGHWVQGAGAMLVVVVFAVGFHLLVRLSGDLYTAIAVHVLYDFLAGLLLWRISAPPRTSPPSLCPPARPAPTLPSHEDP